MVENLYKLSCCYKGVHFGGQMPNYVIRVQVLVTRLLEQYGRPGNDNCAFEKNNA